jgi:hypothetical protein
MSSLLGFNLSVCIIIISSDLARASKDCRKVGKSQSKRARLAGVSEQTLYLPSDKPAELASSGLTKYASQYKERKKYTQNQSESEIRNQKMLQTSCMTRHCRLTNIPCPRHLLATDHTRLGRVSSYKQPVQGGIAVKETGLGIEDFLLPP